MKVQATTILAAFFATASAINCSSEVTCVKSSCQPGSGFCTYRYGPSVEWSDQNDEYYNQEADIYLPAGYDGTSSFSIVVLVHGGYWRGQYRRSSPYSDMSPLAIDLQRRGYIAINLEYRRATVYSGGDTGGFPETFNDLIDGVDALTCNPCSLVASDGSGTSKVVIAGHSAGGTLALWRTLQRGLSSADRTKHGIHDAFLEPDAAIGLAAVSDFEKPCSGDVSATSSKIEAFLAFGTKGYLNYCRNPIHSIVSPLQMLDGANKALATVVPHKLVHGRDDSHVLPIQSKRFVNETMGLDNVDGRPGFESGGHFSVIDPTDALWTTQVLPFLDAVLSVGTSNEEL